VIEAVEALLDQTIEFASEEVSSTVALSHKVVVPLAEIVGAFGNELTVTAKSVNSEPQAFVAVARIVNELVIAETKPVEGLTVAPPDSME
jgi:hypothetical protein